MTKLFLVAAGCLALLLAGCAGPIGKAPIGKTPVGKTPVVTKY
jgi:hypothetical protein